MKLNIDHKLVGSISKDIINNLLNNIDEVDWYRDDYRITAGNMQDTNSIPIVHTALCATDGTFKAFETIERRKLYSKLYPSVSPFIEELKKYYLFNLSTSFISRLKPKGIIGIHSDSGMFLETCHRIHIPLKSNPNVFYHINGKNYFWEPGNIYEFDNTLPHGVFNHSDEERIHLVINLYNLSNDKLKLLDVENIQ
jgi:hypothetical protein